MMFTASSSQVFEFYYDMCEELRVWELLEWRAQPDQFVVHDMRRTRAEMTATTAFTREHFTDRDAARQYIQQQAIAAALNKYEERK